MANYFCGCGRCTVGAVTGPLLLITVGVLFAMEQAGLYRFRETWPVLLVVYGVARLVASVVPAHNGR